MAIDPRFLAEIGDVATSPPVWGPAVASAFVDRFAPVISDGLPNKEARDALLQKLVVPENLPGLAPPKLNAELIAALPKPATTADSAAQHRQMILGKCVGSLLAILDRFATVDVSTFPPGVLLNLADTTKLLSDLFHDDTKIRRGQLKPLLAPEIVAVLEKSEHNDNFLYGSVPDAVQSTTAAKKSVATLLRRPAGNGQGPSRENKYPRPGGAARPRFRKNLPTPTTPAAKKPLREQQRAKPRPPATPRRPHRR